MSRDLDRARDDNFSVSSSSGRPCQRERKAMQASQRGTQGPSQGRVGHSRIAGGASSSPSRIGASGVFQCPEPPRGEITSRLIMTSLLRLFNELGAALRLLRRTAGLKQVQVAERTGIAQGRISRYETERKTPDVLTLDRLLVCYGADLERIGRGLKEVRDKRAGKSSGVDQRKCQTFQERCATTTWRSPLPRAPVPSAGAARLLRGGGSNHGWRTSLELPPWAAISSHFA